MTPRTSSRASARRHYLDMRGRELVFALAPEAGQGVPRKVEVEGLEESAPTPDPSPRLADARGGGEKPEQGGGEKEDLMARVRALYEDSAVPVREIARLCGVTERTLYKYIRRGGWRRRYVRAPADDASTGSVSGAERGARWLRASGHEPVKGAGGRFVPRSEAGPPVAQEIAQGIKALDPDARQRAATACAAALARAAKARAKADAAQAWEARRRAIDSVSAAMAAYSRWRQGRARRAAKFFYEGGPNNAERADDARTEALYIAQIEAAMACLNKLKM